MGKSLSLVAGSSSIVLTKEGQLIINGSGTVKINGKKVNLNNASVTGGGGSSSVATAAENEDNDSDWLDAALAVGSGVLLAAATRRRVKPTGKINAGVDTSKFGSYRPNRTLPRDKHGNNIPDENVPHTQLGTKKGRNGEYTQAREWGYDSNGKLVPKRDIDFTDHGRPAEHNRPHQHDYVPNSTGGTLKRDNERSLEMPE